MHDKKALDNIRVLCPQFTMASKLSFPCKPTFLLPQQNNVVQWDCKLLGF